MEQQIKSYIEELSELKNLNYKIITSQKGHNDIPQLKPNEMGIYIYIFEKEFLKIGKCWSNSGARWKYQHYNSCSTKSNLAKSIIGDPEFCAKNNINLKDKVFIKDWIKNNTTRISIIIERGKSPQKEYFYLNLLEAWLHIKCNPKYEGYKSERQL